MGENGEGVRWTKESNLNRGVHQNRPDVRANVLLSCHCPRYGEVGTFYFLTAWAKAATDANGGSHSTENPNSEEIYVSALAHGWIEQPSSSSRGPWHSCRRFVVGFIIRLAPHRDEHCSCLWTFSLNIDEKQFCVIALCTTAARPRSQLQTSADLICSCLLSIRFLRVSYSYNKSASSARSLFSFNCIVTFYLSPSLLMYKSSGVRPGSEQIAESSNDFGHAHLSSDDAILCNTILRWFAQQVVE